MTRLSDFLAHVVLDEPYPRRKAPQRATGAHGRGPARDEDYKAWIRTLPSVVSGKGPCEACHTGTDGGMGEKASDYSCLPLTPAEHREYHQIGKPAFARKYRLNYRSLCRRLNREWEAVQTIARAG